MSGATTERRTGMSVFHIERADFMREEDVVIFEDSVRRFCEQNIPEERAAAWRDAGVVERAAWEEAAQAGLLCVSVPEEYGGAGGDFRHEAVIIEQTAKLGLAGFMIPIHNLLCAPYILKYGTEEQKQRWLPKLASGELIGAIAMSEPGGGSDLQAVRTSARREGDDYVVNGQKTFISNGQLADLIIVVAKTDPAQGSRGISLIVVEVGEVTGFERGRNLDKIGMDEQDTSELFFNDVRVPAENLLGGAPGQGFVQLMNMLPTERLSIAVGGVAIIERALEHTLEYVKDRKVFGQRVIDFQNTQFKLAECKTEATIARIFVDRLIGLYVEGKLDATAASMAKYWLSDLENKIVDICLQLFGGYGYMNEYPIARMYRDSRAQRIYGGTNEIMKVLIARTL
ncbi:MAG: acyl-CoA dehydrogenase family protein [Pseudodonghicola sp.]